MNGTTEKIKIQNPHFLFSAATREQFLSPEKPMVAVCGKSNVGKSSLINALAGNKKLAKTSSAPGRTRLINYFDMGEFILADLPGYGYAEVSKAEKAKWAKTLDEFFKEKGKIAHVFLLVDGRHDPTEDDLQMIEFLTYHILPFTVLLTKTDKLSKAQKSRHRAVIASELALGVENLILTSAETGDGKDELREKLFQIVSTANGCETEETDERAGGEA